MTKHDNETQAFTGAAFPSPLMKYFVV